MVMSWGFLKCANMVRREDNEWIEPNGDRGSQDASIIEPCHARTCIQLSSTHSKYGKPKESWTNLARLYRTSGWFLVHPMGELIVSLFIEKDHGQLLIESAHHSYRSISRVCGIPRFFFARKWSARESYVLYSIWSFFSHVFGVAWLVSSYWHSWWTFPQNPMVTIQCTRTNISRARSIP